MTPVTTTGAPVTRTVTLSGGTMSLGTLLTLPSLALQTTAKALRLLAFANEVIADRLATPPAASSSEGDTPPRRPAPAPSPAPAPAAAADASPPAPRDIATLAALPAPALVGALDDLSLTELADLFDHESKYRRRRTVLSAIETALAPPAAAASDDVAVDEVRVPDELVYSTATPTR